MGKLARQVRTAVEKSVVAQLERTGKEMVTDLKELVSIPGTRKNHSRPGEPPSYRTDRRRGRHYRSGFTSKVTLAGKKIQLVVDNTTHGGKRKQWLEELLNRPHFEPVEREYKSKVLLAFARLFR